MPRLSVILQHLRLSCVSRRLVQYFWAFVYGIFRVNVCGTVRDVRPVTQGVPKGSVPRHTLFHSGMKNDKCNSH